jgi:transcriptional regulator with XRE-family HTH domain
MNGQPKKSAKKASKPLNVDDQMKKVGNRIKQLRLQAGFTSYEYFAYEHDFSRAQVGRYERGQDLRISSLIRLVNAFGITLEEFFSEGF